ncbi:MAG: hypothetical protein LH472_00035 [Pyrinomonadaceae bacterium]|nr:hypothetical protein [Pyrinomonadaceae bacterium]
MNAAVTTTVISNPMNLSATDAVNDENAPVLPVPDADETAFELGLWLSGLESFFNVHNYLFADEHRAKAAARDWTKEFRLTHSTLLRCSRLIFQLGKTLKEDDSIDEFDFDFEQDAASKAVEFTADEIYEFSQIVQESVQLNEALLRAAPLKFGEWTAWSNLLAGKLKTTKIFSRMIEFAEQKGEQFLPEILRNLLETKPLSLATQTDLRRVLPHFGKILQWLNEIDKMLKNDEPLKPALLLFSRIYEQIQELMGFVNNRLLRFSNEDDELFGLLDGAAYTASIELRKVYQHELAGLIEIRQTPLIYAKMETAYSLLNDSFQQTLVTFAQLIEPNIEPTKLFPNFQSKLQQSQILRRNLWQTLQVVQETEKNPEKTKLDALHKQLNDFNDTTLHFLFYKDMETVERFIEEVLVTPDKKDLVPILHRFGAYLETLFGQVNMRTVLAGHPFESN